MTSLTELPPRPALRSPWLRTAIGIALAAALLFLLGREIEWQSVFARLGQTHPWWLALGLLAALINGISKALRWRALFPPQQSPPAPRDAFGALMAGQLINSVLPFRSGDLSRAYFMGRHRGDSTAVAAGTIGAEKLIDLIIMGLLLALVVPYFVLPAWLESNLQGVYIAMAGALVIWLGLVLALPTAESLLIRLGDRIRPLSGLIRVFVRLLGGLRSLGHVRRLPLLVVWSFIAWGSGLAITYFLLLALDLPATIPITVLVVVIIQSGISVPVAPGNIGVFEWLAVLALRVVGVEGEAALAFGLITHAVVLTFPVIIGIPWLWRKTGTP